MNGIRNLNVLKKNMPTIWILIVIPMNLFLLVGHIMEQRNRQEFVQQLKRINNGMSPCSREFANTINNLVVNHRKVIVLWIIPIK